MSRTTTGLATLFFFALVLRVAAIVVFAAPADRPQTYEHGEIAQNLLAGRGFTVTFLGVEGPTSQQAPFVPALLAASCALTAGDMPQAIWLVQLLQACTGAVLTVVVAQLAWSLVPTNRLTGWIAGYGAALYPPHVYMSTHIQAAPWAALVLTLLLACVLARGATTWRTFITAGLLAGWLLLIEPILALALPICALALGLRAARTNNPRFSITPLLTRPALRAMTVMTLTTLAVVTPWLVRNYRVHGEFVFIKSTFGYAFWQANHPLSWGTDKIPKPSVEAIRTAHDGSWRGRSEAIWQARHETIYIDDLLLKPYGYERFAGLSEPARSRLLGAEAKAFITADPLRYGQLCLRRLSYFLWRDATNPKTADIIYRLSTAAWLGLVIAGLFVTRRQLMAWWPLWSVFLVVTIFHALTIVSARFRIPLEPLTFVWAASAVTSLFAPAARFLGARYSRWGVYLPRRAAHACGVSATSGS